MFIGLGISYTIQDIFFSFLCSINLCWLNDNSSSVNIPFLAHLSTKCSWWAIVIVLCLSSVIFLPCVRSRGHIFSPVLMNFRNLVRMFVSVKSRTSSKLGHVGSKTRSLGQILEKHCVPSRGHIFSPILIKLDQNVCLDEISDEIEIWSCGVKN